MQLISLEENSTDIADIIGPIDPLTVCAIKAVRQLGDPTLVCAIVIDEYVEDAKAYAISTTDYQKFINNLAKASLDRLLGIYSEFVTLFNKHIAQILLPHRLGKDYEIKLQLGTTLLFKRPFPILQQENEVIKKQIDDQLELGNIRGLVLLAAAPVLIVRKPGSGLRVCLDFRGLNALTIKSRYPIPLLQETLNRLVGKKWFTKLDVIAAFNRIRIAVGDKQKTAFSTRYGQYECIVMPFGLYNALGTFQSYINDALREFLDEFASAYLDDCLIFSDTFEEYIRYIKAVMQRLLDASLQLDINKCKFYIYETKYLRLIISEHSIRIDLEKVATIQNWQLPIYVKDV